MATFWPRHRFPPRASWTDLLRTAGDDEATDQHHDAGQGHSNHLVSDARGLGPTEIRVGPFVLAYPGRRRCRHSLAERWWESEQRPVRTRRPVAVLDAWHTGGDPHHLHAGRGADILECPMCSPPFHPRLGVQ
jgi:hypothetical protein